MVSESTWGSVLSCPHTGFQDPNTPEGTPLRESIELRALVFAFCCIYMRSYILLILPLYNPRGRIVITMTRMHVTRTIHCCWQGPEVQLDVRIWGGPGLDAPTCPSQSHKRNRSLLLGTHILNITARKTMAKTCFGVDPFSCVSDKRRCAERLPTDSLSQGEPE